MRELLVLLKAADISVRGPLIRIALTSLAGAALETVGLVLAVRIFGQLFESSDESLSFVGVELSIPQTFALGMICIALSGGLQYIAGRASSRLSAAYLSALRMQVFDAARHAASDAQDRIGEGRVQQLTTSVAYQASFLPIRAGVIVSAGIATCALVISALVIEPLVAMVLIVAGLLLALGLRSISEASSSAADDHSARADDLAIDTATWATRLSAFRLFGVEDEALETVAASVDRSSSAVERLRSISQSGIVVYRVLTMCLLLVLVAVAAAVDLIDAVSATLALVIVLRALSYAQQLNAARQVAYEAIGPTRELLRARDELRTAVQVSDRALSRDFSVIEARGLRLEFDDRSILDGVDLAIRAGERVGIVGSSGSGKSLLLGALAGLVQPSSGGVTLDGVPIESIKPADRARIVALATQSTTLIPGTLIDNVRFLRDWVKDAEIDAAVHGVGLGNETTLHDRAEVGKSDSGLSGGQAQRVGIARALAGQPRLLLLDEPTSALDQASEAVVANTLERLPTGLACVIVSHRPEPLKLCDRFIAVHDGSARELPDLTAALRFCERQEHEWLTGEP